jgi:hypothetical protein
MIEEVVRYKTSDGHIFDTKGRAKAYEDKLSFKSELDQMGNRLYSDSGPVDPEDLIDWILEHKDLIEKIYKFYEDSEGVI